MSAGLLLASRTGAQTKKVPVALMKGEDRRANMLAALEQIGGEIMAKLKGKKTVVLKPNNVSTIRQLAATHVDAMQAVLDFLDKKGWRGEVVIAESSAGHTPDGFANFKYQQALDDHKKFNGKLVCLNEEALYETVYLLNGDLHIQPCRLGKRLLDPSAFVVSCGVLKTHNVLIATLNIKNMTLGAPLHNKRGETPRWNDKRIYHGGVRQTHYDVMLTAQRMCPNWGLAIIDGFEGMEGNGPSQGTTVESRVAIASTDFVAADRIGVESMGIDPAWMGYLQWCEKVGVGTFDRENIELRGEKVETVVKKYRLHADIDRELQWMGPLTELPPKLG